MYECNELNEIVCYHGAYCRNCFIEIFDVTIVTLYWFKQSSSFQFENA